MNIQRRRRGWCSNVYSDVYGEACSIASTQQQQQQQYRLDTMASTSTRCSFLSLVFLSLILFQSTVQAQKRDRERQRDRDDEDIEGKDDNMVEINTHSGPVLGKTIETDDKQKLYSFLGIPYAETPKGELRFQEPIMKKPWQDTFNATEFGANCVQTGLLFGDDLGKQIGEEDCLFINVLTPRLPVQNLGRATPSSSLLPVMVFVHGGGFVIGSGNENPERLVKKGVIGVTFNYRLGAYGFLNLGNPFISGNQGLKDQLMAFLWVQRNIQDFGGDPTKVTIFGESAGGASVHLHQLSPLGRGLYRGIIVQSGSALSPWLKLHHRNLAIETGKRFAREVGCDDIDPQAELECLQEKEIEDLVVETNPDIAVMLENTLQGNSTDFSWLPSIDSISHNSFLPRHPINVMKSGQQKDIPMIIGAMENDGAFLVSLNWNNLETMNANWSYFGPNTLYGVPFEKVIPLQELNANVTRHFYLGTQDLSQDMKQELTDMYTDAMFVSATAKAIGLQSRSQNSPMFLYEITHQASRSVSEIIGALSGAENEDFGASHADDLLYLFKDTLGFDDAIITDEDKKVANVMTTLWTNFAKHQDPAPYHDDAIPHWDEFTGQKSCLCIVPKFEMEVA